MDDLISRRDAKSKQVYSHERHEYVVPVAELDWLPPAQPEQIARDIATIIENERDMRVLNAPSAQPEIPEIIRCKDCKYAEVADKEDRQDGYTCQFHRGSIWFSGSYCSWAERRQDADSSGNMSGTQKELKCTETHSCDSERTETHDLVSRDAVVKAILQLDNLIYTVPDYIDAVRSVPSAEPESRREWYMKGYRDAQNAALHESCTDCPLYDHDRHNCPRFNRVIPATIEAAKPRWIPVTERQPEYGAEVLTINTDGDYEINHIIDEEDAEWFLNGVIAWRELPEPYKEEQND